MAMLAQARDDRSGFDRWRQAGRQKFESLPQKETLGRIRGLRTRDHSGRLDIYIHSDWLF